MNNTEYDLLTKEKLLELYEEALDKIEQLESVIEYGDYDDGFEDGYSAGKEYGEEVGYSEGFEDGKASVEPDPYNNGGY